MEVVHLGENKARLAEAEQRGVKSVPALVIDTGAPHPRNIMPRLAQELCAAYVNLTRLTDRCVLEML